LRKALRSIKAEITTLQNKDGNHKDQQRPLPRLRSSPTSTSHLSAKRSTTKLEDLELAEKQIKASSTNKSFHKIKKWGELILTTEFKRSSHHAQARL
jgi:hypothetical protein